jgi:hypothetical protein
LCVQRAINAATKKLKIQIKSQKPVFKVVQNMLTKKKDKQHGDLTLRQFLDTYKKPLGASCIDAIKNLSKVAMVMEAIRKTADAREREEEEGKKIRRKESVTSTSPTKTESGEESCARLSCLTPVTTLLS